MDEAGPTDPRNFYDNLAESYHLIFEDWDRSIDRQGEVLSHIIRRWPSHSGIVLDAAAGIGTQTLALGRHGFNVVGSDVSMTAVVRAHREADSRGISALFAVADFRRLPFRSGVADVVIACDNALPHLPSNAEIRAALRGLSRCARSGGGVVISMRDYSPQPAGTREVRPYGEREWQGRRYWAEQEWLWQDSNSYVLTLRIRPLEDGSSGTVTLRTTYFAVPIDDVLELMRDVGLVDVQRLDDLYYQPLLIGTVPHTRQ